MADLRVLTSNPQSPEEWMGLLRQQETLHRATEFKWRNTLNTVSSFLRQTQDSLTHLEKDIEPDSELIRSILEQIHSKPPSSAPTSGREGSILEPQDQQGSDKPVVESAS
jgi:DnaJ-domain-containing protein 1